MFRPILLKTSSSMINAVFRDNDTATVNKIISSCSNYGWQLCSDKSMYKYIGFMLKLGKKRVYSLNIITSTFNSVSVCSHTHLR